MNTKFNIISLILQKDNIQIFTKEGDRFNLSRLNYQNYLDVEKFITDVIFHIDRGEYPTINLEDYIMNKVSELSSDKFIIQVIDNKIVGGLFNPIIKTEMIVPTDNPKEPDIKLDITPITNQINRSIKEQSPAIINLLNRVTNIIKERKHSVEDLLKFIEKNELPITIDGRVLAYKLLKKKENDYVDIYTGSLTQNVGTRVTMDVFYVDKNRFNHCSKGLHVARLNYLHQFHGDSLALVLVNPEDFIAVPNDSSDKARVCAYDIVAILNKDAYLTLKKSEISYNHEFRKLVTDIVNGNYVRPTKEILVLQDRILKVTNLTPETSSHTEVKISGEPIISDTIVKNNEEIIDQMKQKDIPQNVKNLFDDMFINKLTKVALAKKYLVSTRTIGRWMDKYNYEEYVKQNTKPKSNKEIIRDLYNSWLKDKSEANLKALNDFRIKLKKSFKSLHFTDEEIKKLQGKE